MEAETGYKAMEKRICIFLICALALAACTGRHQEPPVNDSTTDTARDTSHEEITWDLIQMVQHNTEVKTLLEKSISKAYAINPDPDTNPVDCLENYYAFIDRTVKCMPWEIDPSQEHSSLYDRIDQSMGCLYFVIDQPLEELEDKGYFHNSIMYHEPFRTWWTQFLSVNGQFLNSEASWNDTYYKNALKEEGFGLDTGLYENPSNWHNFNDFFARKLKDPSLRPVEAERR